MNKKGRSFYLRPNNDSKEEPMTTDSNIKTREVQEHVANRLEGIAGTLFFYAENEGHNGSTAAAAMMNNVIEDLYRCINELRGA